MDLSRTTHKCICALLVSVLVGGADGPAVQTMSPPAQGVGLPQIVNGDRQDEDGWRATFRFLADGRFYCTSTIIGSQVVLTAAHCLAPGAAVQIEIEEGRPITLRCEAHPDYRRADLYADIALCLSDVTLPSSRQISGEQKPMEYESIDVRVTRIRTGSQLFLLGYGCRAYPTAASPAAGNDATAAGQLYGGLGQIELLPRYLGEHFRAIGGAAICPGDSGGAAFALSDTGKPKGPRSIIGINSGYLPVGQISEITALYGVEKFIRDWADDYGVQICGIHDNARNCRAKFSL